MNNNLKHAFRKAAYGLYWLFVEPHIERRERYRDFLKESHKFDKRSTKHLVHGVDRNRYVAIGDVKKILSRIQSRIDTGFSDYDHAAYVQPYFNTLEARIKAGGIEGRLFLYEKVPTDTRVRVGDLLDLMQDFDLPAGNEDDPHASEEIVVPQEGAYDDNTWLGRFQRKMNEDMPLRTPSIPVEYKRQATDRSLNIARPLVLAIVLAAKFRDRTRAVEMENIPTYKQTEVQRKINDQKPKPPRYYRGNRMD